MCWTVEGFVLRRHGGRCDKNLDPCKPGTLELDETGREKVLEK